METYYEVLIDKKRCKGCDYCVAFCPNDCISLPKDFTSTTGGTSAKLGSGFGSGVGYAIPLVTNPERCTGCGDCVWMCPHWAIEVNRCIESKDKDTVKEKIAGAPRLLIDPPLGQCRGCQHPTVGRIVAEVLDEMGLGDEAIAFDSIPCSLSSAFSMDYGRKVTYGEVSFDLATAAKRSSPDAAVVVVQGYWGMSDFSFDINSFINTLVRGENFTVILCNMPFYSPIYGHIIGTNEGRLEPVTRINTPEGERIIVGGNPPQLAELAASFPGTAYSARSTITSPKDYQLTKSYVKTALSKQMDNSGFSFVEVLLTCTDSTFSAPVDCLKWVKDSMNVNFPTGEFKNI
jgi:2-oxoglutarate ferredoxin oxidoreductase subunit beta